MSQGTNGRSTSASRTFEKADIYVGLFAFRYGYVPPAHHENPKGLSITELEFRHAEQLKKPCLVFLADQRAARVPFRSRFDAFQPRENENGRRI